MRGHCYDALVGLAGCDKSLPGMMMAMLRLNVPAVFLYGGSILPGKFKGKDVTVVDVFEGVGQHSAGKMSDARPARARVRRLSRRRRLRRPVHRQHHGLVSEAIGLALPLSAGAPAPYESRDEYATASGEAVMRLLADGIRPRDICTRKAFENAATIVAATGGSTNGGLHLPAMAHECGIEFDLMDVAAIFKTHALHRRPQARRQVRRQGHLRHRRRAAGDARAARRRLPARDCLTVTGKTIKQNLENVKFNDKSEGCLSAFRSPYRRPAGWSGCRARWRRTAPSSRWPA